MTFRGSVKILLVFHLVLAVMTAPTTDASSKAATETDGKKSPQRNFSEEHALVELLMGKSTESEKDVVQPGTTDVTPLQKSGQVLRLATLLPAESLRLLQMLAVPIVNTSIAVPASNLEQAANVSPSKGLHEIGSLKQRAEAAVHDKILTPVSNFVGASVNHSRKTLPSMFVSRFSAPHVASLKHHFLVQQIDTLRRDISTELLRLKRTLLLLNQVPGIHMIMGQNGAAEHSAEANSKENAVHELKTPETVTPQGNTLDSADSQPNI